MKRTTKSIQAEIAKGAFRPHTALSTMALAYYQQETTSSVSYTHLTLPTKA